MTAKELRDLFNTHPYVGYRPVDFAVSRNTYANVVHEIIQHKLENNTDGDFIKLAIGLNGGVMFKGVELIIVDHLND